MPKYSIAEIAEFSADKRIRKTLAKGKIEVDVLFYEPGQSSPEHKHDRQDEVFYVVQGKGTMMLDGRPVTLKEHDVMLVPINTTHGINNSSSSRLVMMFVKNAL